jgi:hypothetical protein
VDFDDKIIVKRSISSLQQSSLALVSSKLFVCFAKALWFLRGMRIDEFNAKLEKLNSKERKG